MAEIANLKLKVDELIADTEVATPKIVGPVEVTGAVTLSGTLAVGGTVTIENNTYLRGKSSGGLALNALKVDTAGDVQLGDSSGIIWVKTVVATAANHSAGGASLNGRFSIDSTNNRFIYYSGNGRFYITGTEF